MEISTTDQVPGIDVEPVTRWICERVDMEPPLRFEPIPGGRSNPTYIVHDQQSRKVVLRRPPLGHVLATAHDVGREFRVISALSTTGVPVPEAIGLCDDVDVNGAPFYVMGHVDGQVVNDPSLAHLDPTVSRTDVGRNLVDVLVALHSLDVDDIGLGDLGRRDGYVERQLKRWQRQLEAQGDTGFDLLPAVHKMLADAVPPEQGSGVVHGDYRLGNTIIGTDGRTRAVLDWELTTLGDGMADLGWLLNYWPGPAEWTTDSLGDDVSAPGIGSRRDLIEHYAAQSGKDVSHILYFVAFAKWRAACILSGVYFRFQAGVMTVADGAVDSIRQDMSTLAQTAYDILSSSN